MLRNYLAAALRNLVRNRLYAAINIIGLAVGFAAALLIALFVRDEFSYDKWIPGSDKSYLVSGTFTSPGRAPKYLDWTPSEFAAWMKLDFPAIQDIARLTGKVGDNSDIRRGDIEANESFFWADPDFFTIVPLPVVAGNLQSALHQADGIAISRKIARKYFGRDDPIGETLELGRKNIMKVLAVFEDLPTNTHLSFDLVGSGLASFSTLTYFDAHPHGDGAYLVDSYTYLRLASGGSIQKIRDGMPDFFRRHMRAASENRAGNKYEFRLTRLSDIHLSPGNILTMKPRGDLSVIYGVSAVGILIIAIAIINFINLMTARAVRRAIEVGVRKVTGAGRRHLVLQFVGEAFIYVFAAVILALGLTALVLPKLNAFLERSISFAFWRDPILAAGLVCGAVIIAVLAGAYPAFVLSRFPPATVLKAGDVRSPGSSLVRHILVVTQFAILIGLMVATGVIYRQTSYAFTESMRLDRDQVLLVSGRCKTAFRDEVAKLKGVRSAACGSDSALDIGGVNNGPFKGPDGSVVDVQLVSVGFGFFDFYHFKPVAGRFFVEGRASDIVPEQKDENDTKDEKDPNKNETIDAGAARPAAVVLNETAVRRLGFPSPEDAVGKFLDTKPSVLGEQSGRGAAQAEIIVQAEIIGVAPDFALDTIHAPLAPSIYFVNPNFNGFLNVRLTGQEIPETLAAIDRLWKELGDPRPISRSFLEKRVEALYMDVTRQSQIFEFFAGIALFVACLGLFGLSAFTAERRTKEIGVRKAMGASKADILKLILWEFAKPVLWANVIAWPAGYFVMHRWLESFAYHVDLSPWTFLAASALALGIAVVTVIGHALLIARSQPVAALRYE